MSGEGSDHTVVIKWSGQEFRLSLQKDATVGDLKKATQDATGVLPERQKLLGLKFKGLCHVADMNNIFLRDENN